MKHAEDTELLLERARREEPRARETTPPPAPRAYPGYAVRSNRKAVRRRTSTFTIIAALALLGAAAVLYISNILAVNRLADEVSLLRTRLDERINANRILKADIDRKSTWDRISTIAVEKLGLVHPTEQPPTIVVPERRVRELTP